MDLDSWLLSGPLHANEKPREDEHSRQEQLSRPLMETATSTDARLRPRLKPVYCVALAVLIVVPVVLMYWNVIFEMVSQWWSDEGSSHGFLIVPLALYIAWRQRKSVLAEPVAPETRGLLLSLLACVLYVIGRLAAEFFLARVSLVVLLAGIIWTFWGSGRLRRLAFPVLLLFTMVPLPTIVFNQLAGPLQLLASRLATGVARFCGVAVFRDGNVINLADVSLGVAEACSGLRSISSLIIAALLLGYIELKRLETRFVLFAVAIPAAILTNIVRVAGTALIADVYPSLALGFYHTFSGWLVFVAGLGLLLLATKTLKVLEGRR
jgi:exosortase